MEKKYLIALDQGTTSSRAVIFTFDGTMVASKNHEFPQIYPQPGWVEHNPQDILDSQLKSLKEVVAESGINPAEVAAIGITNQRETTIAWDKATGKCCYNAIVWQCRRTAPYVEELKRQGYADFFRDTTGLLPDAYFAGTKLKWILDHEKLYKEAEEGKLCFGTVESFLAWNLVEGHPHVTDATNASRTMLFNINTQQWDDELLKIMGIPKAILPTVVDSSCVIGNLRSDILGCPIPVASLIGDQHASLFGQKCFQPGMVKNTYGTGCFMLMNAGERPIRSTHGLITTTAWRLNGKPTYALEGSVFMGGATIQWLRDELKMITKASETEEIAKSVESTDGVYLVPAFTGLGAPYWDMYARGTLVGMTRGTSRAHIVRAALEAIAYQSCDLMQAMAADCGYTPTQLQVDGGASANGFMMQFEADIMNLTVVRPKVLETTAMGAALLAGLAVGVYKNLDETANVWHKDAVFEPAIGVGHRKRLLEGWHKAVERSQRWVAEEN